MSTSIIDLTTARGRAVAVTDDSLIVELIDGRSVTVPLAWFPRLQHAQTPERDNWRFLGNGEGIHWPALDEDISIANLLAGNRSGESPASFDRWLKSRGAPTA